MKYTMVRLAIAILLGAVVGNSANAGFGSHGGLFGGSSGGASSGYGSSGGAGYGSSGGASYSGYGSSGGTYVASYGSSGGGSSGGASAGGSSGHPGLLSRLHSRVHSHIAAKHARRASYGSSGGLSGGSSGGYAGYGSSGGSYSGGSSGGYYTGYSSVGGGSSGGISYGSTGSVSYGSTGSPSYGSTGSAIHSGYGSSGTVIQSGYGSVGTSLAAPYYGASTTSPSHTSALVSSSRADDSVKLNLNVPESAKVYVNDRLTTSTGEVRQFVSKGLESGKSYRFEIRAEINENGKVVTDTQTVVVTAGAQENVRFAFKSAPKADPKVDTAVVLNVPENAEVTLAGNQTQVKGTTRVFKTSQLKAGDVWDDYVIQVKVGEQVKTQSIRLIAGDKLELNFDFDNDSNRLAAK